MRKLVIGVVITLVILVGVDRLGDYIAEQAAADTLKNSQHLKNQPDVSIDGFPFLTQLVQGDFDRITATVHDLQLGTSTLSVRMERLHVVLHSLRVSRDLSTVRARSADADGVVTYADLGRPFGATVTYLGDGRLMVTKSVTVLGTTVSGSITVAPALVDGALSLGQAGANQLDRIRRLVQQALDVRLPLNGIPFGITVRTLAARADGLHLALSGTDLVYHR